MSDHEHHSQQSFSVSGTGHHVDNRIGTVNHVVYNGDGRPPVEEVYEIKKARRMPLTTRRLTLISTVAALLSLVPAYATFEPVANFVGAGFTGSGPVISIIGIVGFVVLVKVAVVSWRMRKVTKYRLLRLPKWSRLPAAATVDGRFALVRLHGTCPRCGNRLRFRDRPLRWIERPGLLGRIVKKVTEREQRAECVANPEHCWKIDPADFRPGS